MRISITGDNKVLTSLEAELHANGSRAEKAAYKGDHSELAFSVGDLSTIVAAIGSIAKLGEIIWSLRGRVKSQEEAIIQVKSAAGVVDVHLRSDTTLEQLQHTLSALHEAK